MKTHWIKSTTILDNVQADWEQTGPLDRVTTAPGAFPRNLAFTIDRRSSTELRVMNTEGVEMLFKVRTS